MNIIRANVPIKMLKSYKKTKLNREPSKRHINEIKQSLINSYETTEKIIQHNNFNIGNIKEDNNQYILDGQHRIEAFLEIYEDLKGKNNKNLYDGIHKKLFLLYLENYEFEVKFYCDIENTDKMLDLINEINERLTTNIHSQKQFIRPILEDRIRDKIEKNCKNWTIEVKETNRYNWFKIREVIKIIQSNQTFLVLLYNDTFNENYTLMDDLISMIIQYNEDNYKKINKVFVSKDSIEEKLKKIYNILNNKSLKCCNSKSRNDSSLKEIKKRIDIKYILGTIHNSNYSLWLVPIINKLIEKYKI